MKLKIISLNLWIGGILMKEVLSFLKAENADILLFQEAYDGRGPKIETQYRSLQVFERELGYPYQHFAVAFMENIVETKIPQGNLVLSKFPLKEISTVFYDRPFSERINARYAFSETPRNLQHVTVNLGSTELHILNTQGIWGEDGGDNPRRLAMSEMIVREIGDHQPLLLAGDFNLRPHTRTIANIEKYLRNVFKDELKTSFNLKRKDLEKYPGYAKAVVDMVFVSDDVRVINHSAPPVDISDHLPLIVEIEI